METKEALILVDYQNDFCNPKGSLYVGKSELLEQKIIEKIKKFKKTGRLVVTSKDWHPANHTSFELWPKHAVMNTWGAEIPFGEDLFDKIILKGEKVEYDSYSAFIADDDSSNGLHEYLQEHKVNKVVIIGAATDYCVSATIQHAIELGYDVEVDLDLCRGMEQKIFIKKIHKRF